MDEKMKEGQSDMEAFMTTDCVDHAAAVMGFLGRFLFSNEKIRGTIERNPETGKCIMKREILT